MVTYCISITYNYRSVEAPFTTYGEAVFILLQDIIIIYLILHYNKQAGAALLSVPLSLGLLVGLQYIPLALVQTLQLAAIPATTASRLPQIYTNWKNGHTGDLSAITVFGFALGSIARIFTSLKEAPDPIVLAGFAITSGVNIFMAIQVVYYRGQAPAAKAVKKAHKLDGKEDVSTATTTATTSPPLRARARKT